MFTFSFREIIYNDCCTATFSIFLYCNQMFVLHYFSISDQSAEHYFTVKDVLYINKFVAYPLYKMLPSTLDYVAHLWFTRCFMFNRLSLLSEQDDSQATQFGAKTAWCKFWTRHVGFVKLPSLPLAHWCHIYYLVFFIL